MKRVSPELAALHEADADAVMAYDCAIEMARLTKPDPPAKPASGCAAGLTFLVMGVVLGFLLNEWFFIGGLALGLITGVPWTKPIGQQK
jgi:hypothetical protein